MTDAQERTLDTLSKWCWVAIAEENELSYACSAIDMDWTFSGVILPNGNLSDQRNISPEEWADVQDTADCYCG